MSDEFNRDDLEFYLPEQFKGLSKDYILECVFNDEIQRSWYPKEGDVIVGPTGNIFVISGHHQLTQKLGGDVFFFGGHLCNRSGGIILNDVSCFVLNKDGKEYKYTESGIEAVDNPHYSPFSGFRFVPYPHELKK